MLSLPEMPQKGMLLALVGTYLASFGEGMCTGFPVGSELRWNLHLPSELSETWFHLILPIGGVFGSLTNSLLNKSLGRNKTLMVGSAMAKISMSFLLLAYQLTATWALYLGVFFMGAACGIISHTAPTYLHEVSHHSTRGKIVSGHPAAVAFGLSLSLLLGSEIDLRILTCLTVLPFVFSAIALYLSPPSPLWLAEKNRPQEEIETALTNLYGHTEYAQQELQLYSSRRVQIFSNNVSSPTVNIPILISMGLMVVQQLSGIAGVLTVLHQSGPTGGMITAFAVSHIVVSIVAVGLQDTVGRKTLLYVSSAIELIGLITLGASWSSQKMGLIGATEATAGMVVGVATFVGGYSLGAGPVPWVMMNELSPSRAKTFSTTASTTTSWIFDTIVTQGFTFLLNAAGGPITFLVFSIFVVVSFIFVYLFVPETSGLTIQELEKKLRELYEKLFLNNENNSRSVVINDIEEDGNSQSSQEPKSE